MNENLVKVERNENFSGWWNISVGGFFVEQLSSRAKAIRFARKLAKSRGEKWFSFLTFPQKVDQ